MKKLLLISAFVLSIATSSAQWTDDPAKNTLLATGSTDYHEVLISTQPESKNTFIQWLASHDNGWSPSIQKVDTLGNALWGTNGVHISEPKFNSYSNGIAMAALSDGGIVSVFADSSSKCIAMKINDDGTFAWGEEGIVALETNSCLRTQVAACKDGSFWVMAHDNQYLHLRNYLSDGTPGGPQITISDTNGYKVAFGQLVVDDSGNAFAIYTKEKFNVAYYYYKSLYVTKFAKDGTPLSQEEKLMDEVSISGQICHNACSDGLGGGYAWISHPALNELFEVYLFHFDSNGHSTISEPTGLLVSQPDGINFHSIPSATLHPTSHDLLMVFDEVDANFQRVNGVRINRIKTDGTKVWGDSGIVLIAMTEELLANLIIDAFPDGTGASIVYKINTNSIAAIGINENGKDIWHTTIATPATNIIYLCNRTSGYHNGQNILAWQGIRNDIVGLYGQNLHQDGTLGLSHVTSIANIDKTTLLIYQTDHNLRVEGAEIKQVELFNLTGQRVNVAAINTHTIALGNLPQGIYIVRILTNEGKIHNQKVFVR